MALTKNSRRFEIKANNSPFLNVTITKSSDINTYVRQFYLDDIEIYESMFVILLNKANRTIGYAKISQGGVTGTVCDPRIIVKYAIEVLATSIVLCHNHPSGNTKPSRADESLTEKVKNGLQFFDIVVLDHIIITPNDGYYSFADEGIL